jgi:serine/threonine protein kinase
VQPVAQLTFSKHALASGLVEQADLEAAAAQIGHNNDTASNNSAPWDEQLADQLVAMGRLSRFQATQLLAGHTKLSLGPYQIVDVIGQGGMGQVFRAEHTRMGRTVAVKVLPKSKSTPEAIASFTREIRAQAALDHENLVRALDAGHDGNVYFLVCEYVPGADLRHYLRDRGPLGMAEAATIISQAAEGLEHAHKNGMIHRDVKPANLLVTPDGQTKVSDLGLVGSLNNAESDPRAGKVVGTADYLSPEQIISPRSITAACDIYSLGCTLYYAVTGKVPFPGGNARDKARRHCEDTPLHPRLLNPSLSEAFVEVIAAMMEKDPAKRIATAAEVVERLKPWAGESVSSPRDPIEARRTREVDFDIDSGAGELADTSLSFAFDLIPPRTSARAGEVSPSSSASNVALPPIRRAPVDLVTDNGSSVLARSKPRPMWVKALALVAAALTLVAAIVAIFLYAQPGE